MTKKRLKKLLMGCGADRNTAAMFACVTDSNMTNTEKYRAARWIISNKSAAENWKQAADRICKDVTAAITKVAEAAKIAAEALAGVATAYAAKLEENKKEAINDENIISD